RLRDRDRRVGARRRGGAEAGRERDGAEAAARKRSLDAGARHLRLDDRRDGKAEYEGPPDLPSHQESVVQTVLEPVHEGTRLVGPKHSAVARTVNPAVTLTDEIRQRFEEFSRSQKDVGQYIVDHLDEAAFATAEELARRANTSTSTVVRFAQAPGFEGFPELQASARDQYRRPRGARNGAEPLEAAA